MSLKATVLGLGLMIAGAAVKPCPRLVWNGSASAPIGLYAVTRGEPSRGDLVLVETPASVRSLAAERHYLPANVPLVKRIAAVSGDQICADDVTIYIDGKPVARRLKTDSQGRPMPIWTGCHVLDHEVFLLMADVPASFDGRYFGPVPASSVIGRLTPLWTR